MNILFRGIKAIIQRPTYNYQLPKHPTEKIISQLSEREILDTRLIKQVMAKRIPKRTITSQFGLWHGKQPKSGNQTCFSEKKSRRSWVPNIQQKIFHSEVLERDIHTKLSTKALRCIRKAGSFDNYILLTQPKSLDSVYGEYLKKLMFLKLNNPDFQIPRVAKSRPEVYSKRARRFSQQPAAIWHPPEIRHTDLTFMAMRSEQNMNPRELRQVRAFKELQDKFEDIDESQHPLLDDKFWEEQDQFEEFAEKEGAKAMEKFTSKRNKEKVRLTLKAVEESYLEQSKLIE